MYYMHIYKIPEYLKKKKKEVVDQSISYICKNKHLWFFFPIQRHIQKAQRTSQKRETIWSKQSLYQEALCFAFSEQQNTNRRNKPIQQPLSTLGTFECFIY